MKKTLYNNVHMFNSELINWSIRLLLISFLILDEGVMES